MSNCILLLSQSSPFSRINFLLLASHSSASGLRSRTPHVGVEPIRLKQASDRQLSLDLIDVISYSSSVLLPSNRLHRSASALPGSTFLSRTGDTHPLLYVSKSFKQQLQLRALTGAIQHIGISLRLSEILSSSSLQILL